MSGLLLLHLLLRLSFLRTLHQSSATVWIGERLHVFEVLMSQTAYIAPHAAHTSFSITCTWVQNRQLFTSTSRSLFLVGLSLKCVLDCLTFCPRRVLVQTAKTRRGTLEAPAYREEHFAVAEKISILDVSKRIEKKYAKDIVQSLLGVE